MKSQFHQELSELMETFLDIQKKFEEFLSF